MRSIKAVLLVALALTLSACGNTNSAGSSTAPVIPVAAAPAIFSVDVINVNVPRTLKVSEAHLYYPISDIVWRGDPLGDRYEQVAAIFETGMGRGAKAFSGKRNVVVDVQVKRFHSLTEKARYSIGGVHSINFYMTVRDAKTGETLMDGKEIKADLQAYGGSRAIAAEQRGLTQKVRITSHLAGILQRELTQLSTEIAPNPDQMASDVPAATPLDGDV